MRTRISSAAATSSAAPTIVSSVAVCPRSVSPSRALALTCDTVSGGAACVGACERDVAHCTVLKCAAVWCRELMTHSAVSNVAACVVACECVAVRRNVFRCAGVCCRELMTCDTVSDVAACVRACECVAVCCSALQCAAVCSENL